MSGNVALMNRRTLLGAATAVASLSAAPARAQAPAIDLSGKSILITGSSSGFGRLSAIHCARSGANVIASMRNLKNGKRTEAQELNDIASTEKLKLTAIEIDVTIDEQVNAGVAKSEKIAGGALDAVLNNAGMALEARRRPAEERREEPGQKRSQRKKSENLLLLT